MYEDLLTKISEHVGNTSNEVSSITRLYWFYEWVGDMDANATGWIIAKDEEDVDGNHTITYPIDNALIPPATSDAASFIWNDRNTYTYWAL